MLIQIISSTRCIIMSLTSWWDKGLVMVHPYYFLKVRNPQWSTAQTGNLTCFFSLPISFSSSKSISSRYPLKTASTTGVASLASPKPFVSFERVNSSIDVGIIPLALFSIYIFFFVSITFKKKEDLLYSTG